MVRKRILHILFFSIISINAFALEDGMIIGNDVLVRNQPSLESMCVKKMNRGDIVQISEYKGSRQIKNGIWDYWAKIDDGMWVNASWVLTFPFFCERNHVYIGISNLKHDKTKIIQYFANGDDTSFELPFDKFDYSEDEIIRGIYLARYMLFDESIKAFINEENIIQKKGNETVYKKNGVMIKSIDVEYFTYTPYIEVDTGEFNLWFGVRVGMSKEELISILGKPVFQLDSTIKYVSCEGHYGVITFEFQNDKVSKIKFEWSI